MLVRPVEAGDELLSVTGKPYDTLDEVIGIRGIPGSGSLKEFGITYKQIELKNGEIDFKAITGAINERTRMVFLQRSRGYAFRPPVTTEQIARVVETVKAIRKDILIMVDNCYGEFVETLEPTSVGADVMAGSLIKNPGGGIVPLRRVHCGNP